MTNKTEKFVRSLMRTHQNTKKVAGAVSVPKPVYDGWRAAGVRRVEMEWDSKADTLTITPIKEPLVAVSKPVRRGWFGLDKAS